MTGPGKRNVRWGLLSLLFLAIALICILVSNGQGGTYNAVTLSGLVIGFGGAAYCSYKGLKSFSWLPR